MAAQNVLAGDEKVLEQIILEIREQNLRIDNYNKLAAQIKELGRDIDEEKRNLQNTIESQIKQSSAAVCAGFEKSIDEERARLKDIQSDRERAKDAGVKERISSETAHLRHENEKLKNRIKESFKTDGVPAYCNNSVFMLLFRTTGVWQYFLYIVLLGVFYAVIPYLLFKLLDFGQINIIIYYFVCIFIQSFVGKVMYKKTVIEHFNTLDAAAKMQFDIKDNNRKIRRISKRIRKDKNEEMYGLEEFDSQIKEVRNDIKDIVERKKAVIEEFEKTVKPNIIAELEAVDKDKRDDMEKKLSALNEQYIKLDEQIKLKRMYISSNYEAYLGKEVFDLDKLLKLMQIMKSGQADTIAKALAVYENKSQN